MQPARIRPAGRGCRSRAQDIAVDWGGPAVSAAAAVLLIAAVGGCRLGQSRPESPSERAAAVASIVRAGDTERIPEIIVALGDPDAAVRLVAHLGLLALTDEDFGYHYADPEPDRAAAADRWASWAVSRGLASTTGGGVTGARPADPPEDEGSRTGAASEPRSNGGDRGSGSGGAGSVTDEVARDAP